MISSEEKLSKKIAKISRISKDFLDSIKLDHEFELINVLENSYCRLGICKSCGIRIMIRLIDRRAYTKISNYYLSLYDPDRKGNTVLVSMSNTLKGVTCSNIKQEKMHDALG